MRKSEYRLSGEKIGGIEIQKILFFAQNVLQLGF